MNIAEKTLQLKQDFDDVYEAGKNVGQGDLWDNIQDYGNRTGYAQGFASWGCEYIRPKYKVIPTVANGVSAIFEYCKKLKKVEADYFDFSQKPTGEISNTGYNYSFNSCTQLEEIEDIGLIPQVGYFNAFAYDYKLHTIAKLGTDENTKFSGTFIFCNELINLIIEGTIGQNGFNVQWSTKLTHDSLMNIIDALADKTGDTSGTEWVVTVGSENKAKLTDDELDIAQNKGWQVK